MKKKLQNIRIRFYVYGGFIYMHNAPFHQSLHCYEHDKLYAQLSMKKSFITSGLDLSIILS